MRYKNSILLFLISLNFASLSFGQSSDFEKNYLDFLKSYQSGDLLNAEKSLLNSLYTDDTTDYKVIGSVYNNLGVLSDAMGKYDDALLYYSKAESIYKSKFLNPKLLADVYVNQAIIFINKQSFTTAIEYFEKGIRIYLDINNNDVSEQSLSSAYLNLGIAYLELKDYKNSMLFLDRSISLKQRYNLPGLGLSLLNRAMLSSRMSEDKKAEEQYELSISQFKNEYGKDYFRTAEVYFSFGTFLQSVGKNSESLKALKQALTICLNNYGPNHTLTSLSYKLIGDHYLNLNNIDSALYFYQESLIAVVQDFNNRDIFTNPSIDSALFDIRLLDNLKSKATALELYAANLDDPPLKLKSTQFALSTIELAIDMIDRIRNNYLSEESKIYLAENEKETYMLAIHQANDLYALNHDYSTFIRMYDIAEKAKAVILRNEITENELMWSSGIPDSTLKKRNLLSKNIAAYNYLVLNETKKAVPDIQKMALWKDALFDMNREIERLQVQIDKDYPQFSELLKKSEPVPLSRIQGSLKKNELVIDYLLSNQYINGHRKLYSFLISRDSLRFREEFIDTLFNRNVEKITDALNLKSVENYDTTLFREYTGALWYMYDKLINPVEKFVKGKRLIIIPDEEIGLLPFDAFLRNKPQTAFVDYESLDYLIYSYSFSYGYSSSLIFADSENKSTRKRVLAFAPDYGNTDKGQAGLKGTKEELAAIFKRYNGKMYVGSEVTESSFLNALNTPAIFHLAMHSLTDSLNSRFSYMDFGTALDSLNDGHLYNYEISLNRIQSPMVVLSACNSGTGTLYKGEGLMSLARGFLLAGVSSVIKTSWEVNDETSSAIISGFYTYLSIGKTKDEALRQAKLDYIKNNPPAYKNPYYWAAYEVLGDNSATNRNKLFPLLIIIDILVLAGVVSLIYFRRRRILAARSL